MQTLSSVEELIAKILKDEPLEKIVLTARRFLMVAYLREKDREQRLKIVGAVSECDRYLQRVDYLKYRGGPQS